MESSRTVNLANWEDRVPAHVASPDYAVEAMVADPGLLSDVVRFDRDRLGSLVGQRAVHLQCHIGTDTVSLARLGATVTGLDFSPSALAASRDLAARTGADVRFVEADVYAAAEVLEPGSYDLVYTGVGALCWLPDITGWARVAAELLAPGGRLFVREGHPLLWALDERHTDALVVDFPYFEREHPEVWDDPGTYVDTEATFAHNVTHTWNHGIGQILTAVLDAGLDVTDFVEHDSVPWNALPGQMVRDDASEWRLAERPWRLPASYTLQAVRAS